MKIFKCDLCGKKVGEYRLFKLHEWLMTKRTKEICLECRDAILKQQIKIKEAIRIGQAEETKKFIERLEKEAKT